MREQTLQLEPKQAERISLYYYLCSPEVRERRAPYAAEAYILTKFCFMPRMRNHRMAQAFCA